MNIGLQYDDGGGDFDDGKKLSTKHQYVPVDILKWWLTTMKAVESDERMTLWTRYSRAETKKITEISDSI